MPSRAAWSTTYESEGLEAGAIATAGGRERFTQGACVPWVRVLAALFGRRVGEERARGLKRLRKERGRGEANGVMAGNARCGVRTGRRHRDDGSRVAQCPPPRRSCCMDFLSYLRPCLVPKFFTKWVS